MKISIETILHEEQRYPTVGDYQTDEHGTYVRVSDMGNEDYEFLVALHELVELYLAKKRGITDEAIDAFDMQFERDREAGLHTEDEEPGDDAGCPIRKEHFFATNIERMVALELGVDWTEYDKTVIGL